MLTKAFVYCRVSSEKQKNEGHGLESQEHRCKQYIENKGYECIGVYADDITGSAVKRTGFAKMLEDIEKERALSNEPTVVVVDDIKRWARDVNVHWTLKKAIQALGARLESPNYQFGESPEDQFVETVLAAQGELERKQNSRQVSQKMKARMELGYWSFCPPPGFKSKKYPMHGKMLEADEPKASIIKEALEGFAKERFKTKVDVQKFLDSKRFSHRATYKKVHLEQVSRLINRAPLYAGFIEYPDWKIERREGKHVGIISKKTLELIETRLNEKEPRHHRKDLHKDFPHRGYVSCAQCNELMTASWSKGRNRYFGYYRCTTKGCVQQNKSARKENIEKDFQKVLQKMKPKKNALCLVEAAFEDVWKHRMEHEEQIEQEREGRIKSIDRQIDECCDKITSLKNKVIIQRMEMKVDELEREKAEIEAQSSLLEDPQSDFGIALKEVLRFVKKPSNLWQSGKFEDQRTVLKLGFVGSVPYDKTEGFGTAHFSLLFALCKVAETDKNKMVEMPGIEPGSNVHGGHSYGYVLLDSSVILEKGRDDE